MKIIKKSHSLAFTSVALILLLILVSSIASAFTVDEASSATSQKNTPLSITIVSTSHVPKIAETRISTHKTAANPDIYGNTIVWQDHRNGNWDIYIIDLSTKKEIHTTNSANQTVPAIYGNRVVWEDDRNGGHDIYLQDLSTKKQTRITKNGKACSPAIHDDKIVWTDGRNGGSFDEWGVPVGNWDIYLYDISTRKETQITTNPSKQANPDINGNRIVWEDNREWGGNQIGMYDLSTHNETLLDIGLFIHDPVIYGNWIAWGTDADNIAIHQITAPTSNDNVLLDKEADPAIQRENEVKYTYDVSIDPAIYEDRMVYNYFDRFDYSPNASSEIRVLNLSTMKEVLMSRTGITPEIYGSRIVWADGRNGGSDIYMGTLIYPPASAFSASPTSGKAPLTVKFKDKSTGSPTSCSWNFGDKGTSSARNPVHKYTKVGKYTVTLTVNNAAGTNTKKITNYITVK